MTLFMSFREHLGKFVKIVAIQERTQMDKIK